MLDDATEEDLPILTRGDVSTVTLHPADDELATCSLQVMIYTYTLFNRG